MDQSYPLKPYSTHHSSDVDFGAYPPSDSSQHFRGGPAFFAQPEPINYGYGRTGRGYEPLAEAYTGYEPSAPQVRRTPGWSSLIWWLPEVFASFLAIGCLFAIVAVLRMYDGRSINDINLPGSLTLNGIIAALATLARVALMVPVGSALSQESWIWFARNARQPQQCRSRLKDLELSDVASRGAWGSFLFLLLARRRWLAYIGALVTIVTLAFGTSTQQLLAIDQFPVIDRNSTFMPGNSTFMPGNLPRAETWQYYNANPAETKLTLPFRLRASIYNGMLSDKIDPITVNCPTGNCTWPITPSLAICGECSPSTYSQQCDQKQCNYTMPSGTNISLTNTGDEGIGFVVAANSQGGHYNRSTGDKLYLTNFDVIGAPYLSLAESFHNKDTAASECALWMCVQSYSVNMTAGQLQQNVTMTFSDLTAPWNSSIGVFNNYTFAELPAEMNPSPDVTYNVSFIGAAGFELLYILFNGTAFLDLESSVADSDAVDAIWNASSNLDPWIKNVATSMTNALRYNDPNPSPPSRGSFYPAPDRPIYDGVGFQLGVRVQWRWLILPIACVALAILFLILIMIKTIRSPVAPWKGSLLTFLFFEVDQNIKQRAAGHMNHWRGVLGAVGDNRVFLREESVGKWTFKAA